MPPVINSLFMNNTPLNWTQDNFLQQAKKYGGLNHELASPLFKQLYNFGRIQSTEAIKQLKPNRKMTAELWINSLNIPVPAPENVNDLMDSKKFTTRLEDSFLLESVILPMKGYNTLCISSQAGCARDCLFCATGKMGLLRNLEPAEIIGQVLTARFHLKKEITNIVFMGMGEPLDNFKYLITALEILTDPKGAAFPSSAITVSTAGVVPKIDALAQKIRDNHQLKNLKLAVSLNGPNDSIRSELMPINRQWPMSELKRSIQNFPLPKTRSRILLEYLVIPGINNSVDHCRQIAEWCSNLPVMINVIPYNASPDSHWPSATNEDAKAVHQELIKNGLKCRLRLSKGRKNGAGCGQLGGFYN